MRPASNVLCSVLLLAASARALPPLPPPGDISALTSLRYGTHLLVDSIDAHGRPDLDDRCRLIAADAATLTCAADFDPQVRLTFPITQVRYVYQIQPRRAGAGLWISLGFVVTLLVGLIAGSPQATVIGFIGSLVALGIACDQQRPHWGPPTPPQERLSLIYVR